ncbi:hypothetical protein [Arthrobacter sp. GMC3]|uniref:hypothetical protein n=1 Tax=Arthrobacter sp. GMC3 TaxID=2058894 RepID=UPI0011B029BB|nr:hypothetical protein [Arthrobacter sp. GMC3]
MTNLVDKTISQVPVVNEIVGNGTVGKITAPITGAVDRVESAVTKVPVVGGVVDSVLTPVGNLGNQVVAPVTDVLGSVTTPVLGAVDQITSPVTQILSPVLDPVTGALKPVVDGVTGGATGIVGGVVDVVLPPGTPSTPGTPGTPGTPTTPGAPGSVLPGTLLPGAAMPGVDDASGISPGALNSSFAGTQTPGQTPGVSSSVVVAGHAFQAVSPASGNPVLASAGSGTDVVVQPSCDDDFNAATGPCAPAVTTSASASAGAGSSSGGSGGAGGAAAADQCFPLSYHSAMSSAAMRAANWALPASLTTDPGSSPG